MDSQTDPRPAADSAPSAESAPVTATSSDAAKPGFVASTVEELRKVVWPSRQQLFSESVAVILMVTLSAFAIAAIDRFYSWANTQVFR